MNNPLDLGFETSSLLDFGTQEEQQMVATRPPSDNPFALQIGETPADFAMRLHTMQSALVGQQWQVLQGQMKFAMSEVSVIKEKTFEINDRVENVERILESRDDLAQRLEALENTEPSKFSSQSTSTSIYSDNYEPSLIEWSHIGIMTALGSLFLEKKEVFHALFHRGISVSDPNMSFYVFPKQVLLYYLPWLTGIKFTGTDLKYWFDQLDTTHKYSQRMELNTVKNMREGGQVVPRMVWPKEVQKAIRNGESEVLDRRGNLIWTRREDGTWHRRLAQTVDVFVPGWVKEQNYWMIDAEVFEDLAFKAVGADMAHKVSFLDEEEESSWKYVMEAGKPPAYQKKGEPLINGYRVVSADPVEQPWLGRKGATKRNSYWKPPMEIIADPVALATLDPCEKDLLVVTTDHTWFAELPTKKCRKRKDGSQGRPAAKRPRIPVVV
jgi:hypothetical protein